LKEKDPNFYPVSADAVPSQAAWAVLQNRLILLSGMDHEQQQAAMNQGLWSWSFFDRVQRAFLNIGHAKHLTKARKP